MTTTQTDQAQAFTGTLGVLTAGGVITFALFPLAIPFLILTAAFVAPLGLVGVVVAVPVAIVAGVAVAIRAIARGLGRRRRREERPQPLASAPARQH